MTMRRVFAVVFALSMFLTSASQANDYCDERYKFGSPEWWKCTQDQNNPR